MSLSTAFPQIVSQPQRLDCTAIIPECVAASVQFVWSSGGMELRRIEGTSFCYRYVNSSVCRDMYNISVLNASDQGKVFSCDIIINTIPPAKATTSITLNLQGMCYPIVNSHHVFMVYSSYSYHYHLC